jgi:uncharacterized membrane protein HdeD (DUF308 family)
MSLPPIEDPLMPSLSTAHRLERFRSHWRSMVAFGILSLLLGVLALVLSVSATIASVLMIGILMVVAGTAQLVIGFRTRSWGRFIAYEIAGVIYLLAGLFAVFSPLEASVVLTLLLGAGLIATGVSRVVVASQIHGSMRGTLIWAGIATALLGLLIVLGWPTNSLFILGTLLGVDLIFQGMAWTVFGFQMRSSA